MIWVCVATVILLVLLFVRVRVRMSEVTTDFDREQWVAANAKMGRDSARMQMVEDLTRRFLVTGMPRDQVHALIGLPDIVEPNSKEADHSAEVSERYILTESRDGDNHRDQKVLDLTYSPDETLVRFQSTVS